MANLTDTSTWPAPSEFFRRRAQGITWGEMAAELGVYRATLFRYVNPDYMAADADESDPQSIVAQDQAFIARMLAAMEAGKEPSARVGTYVDPSPSRARPIMQPVTRSLCGSTAALCAI